MTAPRFKGIALSLWCLWPLLAMGPALVCVVPRVIAPLFIVGGLLSILAHWWETREKPTYDRTLLSIFGGLTLFGLISWLWSIAPSDVVSKTVQFAQVFGVTAFLAPILYKLDGIDRDFLFRAVRTGLIAGIGLYLFETFSGFMIYETLNPHKGEVMADVLQNKPTVLLLLWFMMYMGFRLNRKRPGAPKTAIAVLVGLTLVLLTTKSSSAQLMALLAPLYFFGLTILPARLGLFITTGAMLLVLWLMPFTSLQLMRIDGIAANESIPTSMRARIEIWDQTARRISEHPIIGWGLEASRVMPNRGEMSYINGPKKPVKIAHLHPHNAPLQIWFELGLTGMGLATAFILVASNRISRLATPRAVRYATFMTGVIFLSTLTIWGIWQTWFMATLATLMLMAAVIARDGTETPAV